MNPRFTGLLFFFLSTLLGFGQNQFGRVNHYEELNGMIITDLLADRNGEIWITTFSGLLTFDGYDFKNYYPDSRDSTTIDDLLLYKLMEDDEGDIWIGSMNKIYRHDAETGIFKNYPLQEIVDYPVDAQPMIFNIAADHEGTLYFGVVSGTGYDQYPGLLKYLPSKDSFELVNLPNGEPVQNVYGMRSNEKGEIAIISSRGFIRMGPDGMTFQENEELEKYDWLEYEGVRDMVWDNQEHLWIVTNRWRLGKIDFDADTIDFWNFEKPFDGVEDGSVRIGFDKNRLWVSHKEGIELFDLQKAQFDTPADMVSRPFITFMKDEMDNIWLGTGAFGLYCIPPKQSLTSYLHNPDDPNSVTQGWVSNPFEDEEGNIWFPTYNWAGDEGLNKIDPNTGEIEKFLFRDKLPQFNRLQMINAYDQGRLLFRSGNKLYGYDVNTGQVLDPGILSESENIEFLNFVYRDSDGELWICTMSGLYRQTGDKYSLYDLNQGEMGQVVSNEVLQVVESARGGLWVQTNEGLFFLDKKTDRFERHGYDPNKGPVFSSQDINSLLEDKEGYLWVGTWQGGLNKYDPESGNIEYFGIEDGLPSPSVQGILEDAANNVLWLSTFRGISRFDKQSGTFTNYGNEAGAQSLYADRSSLELTSGLFAFGGSNGITVFDPANFSGDTQPPIIRISGMNAGEETISIEGGATAFLDYSQNDLAISYTGIHYDNPSKNQYAYKLSPVDEEWRNVGGSRNAYFYDLAPGDYSFSVRAASPNAVWSEPKMISFSIAPPWWMTWWAYAGYAILLLIVFLMLHRFQKSRTLRKERERAKDRELAHAREIEKAYSDLKAAQTQLIHSEKMASLGELTAGIAHEIKNPLNFVNNFSEVSRELLEEMKEELKKGDTEEADGIANDVIQNLEKIVHHGQRADSIVRGMLQHSRSGDGKKEPTDLNALADEYVRLAYHGLRAKDKSFNATLETDYDPDLPLVDIVPQDVGRALLNLLTNAFHAVSERKNQEPEGYEPTVWVKTKKTDIGVEVSVRDNGSGIPDDIRDKIFQPFFTTKATGKGTGLGLSMSYDIITKGHGGRLKVESNEGKGAVFFVILPI